MQLFSGPQTCKVNTYIYPWFVSVNAYHLFCQIQDLYRFSHIKDQYLPAITHFRCLEDKINRLWYCHKVSCHIRMSNGYRSSPLYLFPEYRNNTAAAVQDIAEPDNHVLCIIG